MEEELEKNPGENPQEKKGLMDMEIFKGKFKAFLAFWVVTLSFVYLWQASFGTYPKNEYVGTVIGFLTGTAIGMVLAFYFSSSSQVDEKALQQQVKDLQQQLGDQTGKPTFAITSETE